MLTLAACGTSASSGRIKAGIDLPVMPADLRMRCGDPGVRAGKDTRIELARNRKALAACNHRHRDTVKFYDDTKREFAN